MNIENIELSALINKCRMHDDTAFSELLRRYTPMIHKVISGFPKSNLEFDELYSEACVALHRAALKYDLEQDQVTFGFFARVCVYNRIIDLLRKEDIGSEMVDLDIELLSDNSEIERGLVARETVSRLLSGAQDLLSEYEFKVLILHIQGYKTAAIAKALARSSKSVDNAKARIFRRMRSEFGAEKDI